MLESLLYILAITGVLVRAQFRSQPTFRPAEIPLAVRSPYLNTWLLAVNETSSTNWPCFWNNPNTVSLLFVSVPNVFVELTTVFQGRGMVGHDSRG
jgi:hypothetical protein